MKHFLLTLTLLLGISPPVFAQATDWHPTSEEMEAALSIVAENHIQSYDRKVCDDYLRVYLMRYSERFQNIVRPAACPVFDRYTFIETPKYSTEEVRHTQGTFAGAGLQIGKGENNTIVVKGFAKDSTGKKAGVLENDVLVAVIDGAARTDLTFENVVPAIVGNGIPGSKFNLVVNRADGEKTIEITRAIVEIPTVHATVATKNAAGVELPKPVGVFVVSKHSSNTVDQLEFEIDKFETEHGEDAPIIIDLWNDPGGVIESAAEFVYIFHRYMGMPTISRHTQGKVLQMTQGMPLAECFDGTLLMLHQDNHAICAPFQHRETGYVKVPGRFADKKMVLLISDGCASACDIIATVAKHSLRSYDSDRIVLIGEKTFGKGIVQYSRPVQVNASRSVFRVHVTAEEFRGPGGRVIHEVGTTPDIVIPLDMNLPEPARYLQQHQAAFDRALAVLFAPRGRPAL